MGEKSTILHIKESAVLKACIQWLYIHGCDIIRCNTGAVARKYTSKRTGQTKEYYIRFGKPGVGDIIACGPTGRWIECECKSSIGKQEAIQKLRQEEIERRHGVYILARSVDDLEARKAEILA